MFAARLLAELELAGEAGLHHPRGGVDLGGQTIDIYIYIYIYIYICMMYIYIYIIT